MRFDRRAVLDLFSTQIHEHELAGLMETSKGMGRNEHLTTCQPASGVRYHIAHGPAQVVEVKILHVANVAIQRAELVAVERFEVS